MIRQPRCVYEFGPFRLIPKERQLFRDGVPVPLTAKSFDLLVALVENAGQLVKKDELMERIWPDCFVEEANLSVNMSALRRVLGEPVNQRSYIETVPRHGYRFAAPVVERLEEPPLSSRVKAADSSATDPRRRWTITPAPPAPAQRAAAPGWPLLLVTLPVLAALFMALNGAGLREHRGATGSTPGVQALAVLPLENLSGDPDQEYFADGLTDALISELAKARALRVISSPAVMHYRRTRKPVSEIGRELKVGAVLTGSVARSGDQVRVAVQLVEVQTGRGLWSGRYEQNLRDVLTMQRAVVRDIVGEIRVKVSPQQLMQFGRLGPVHPEAYDHYLRGQFYLHRQSREGNEAAIRALERAVATDPTFAAAHAELAQAYVWKLFLFAPKEKQWAEKAFVSAEKALALDPNSAVAYLARGRLLWTPANHFPHEKAIREYRRALAINPNLDEARNQLALVYCHIGAFEEALRESEQAMGTNPSNALAQFRTGQTLNFQGRYAEALPILQSLPPEVNPSLVGHQIAWSLFNLGRRREAAAALEQLLRDYPEDPGGLFTSIQAVLAAAAGQRDLAERRIVAAIRIGKGFGHFHHTAYHLGCAYALMNRPGPAVRWLEVAADDGFPCYPMFRQDVNLKNLRADARFTALLARLEKQWEAYSARL